MRVEVDQLNNEIKTAGQTIRIKFAKRDLKEVSSIQFFNDLFLLSEIQYLIACFQAFNLNIVDSRDLIIFFKVRLFL